MSLGLDSRVRIRRLTVMTMQREAHVCSDPDAPSALSGQPAKVASAAAKPSLAFVTPGAR